MIKFKRNLKINPALQIVLGFFVLIMVGTFFLCLPISSASGEWTSFVDGLFTSTSAVCVTGLIVVDTAVHFSLFGQIIILFLIQIGGLGFITLTSIIFLIFGKKISYNNRVAIQESLNKQDVQGVVRLIRNIVILVFVIEFIGFICIAPSTISLYGWGEGLYKALFLSISAFCNAGFDVMGTTATQFTSLSWFAQNSLLLLPIMLLIVIGGIGYIVLFDIGAKFGKDKKKMSFHSKIVLIVTSILIFGGAFLFALFEWNNPNTIGTMNIWDKIVNSFFQSITPRTAGFATFDMADLSPASRVLTSFLMLIGGSPVSTAGGIKTITIFVLIVAIFKTSNSKGDIVLRKKQISNNIIRKAFKVTFMYLLVMIFATFLICLCEGNSITVEEIIFEVISALSTVGISLGITSSLGVISKIVIVICMFIGRVGAVTFAVALAGKRKKINEEIEYPDSRLIVG